jgi:transposase
LQPLPGRYVYAEWRGCTVHIDYHVELDGHFYSVPYRLRMDEKRLEARLSGSTIEVYARGRRVTSHRRSYAKGGYTTNPEHMPKAHQAHMEWTPNRMIHWASTIGPNVESLVTVILKERPHPEQGYRSCLGILRLAKKYGESRLESACRCSLAVGARSYRHVDGVLKNGLDKLEHDTEERPPIQHANIRGSDYYN